MHCGPSTGHFGRRKTIRGIRTRLIWGTLSRDVRKALHTCIHCWKQTGGRLHSQVPQAKPPLGWPGEVPALYAFGPLSTARSGARLILVCMDHFSRWVEMTALARATKDHVVKFLRDVWIPHHGMPRLILSDNGRQFISEVLRNLSESTGARKTYSAAHHPEGTRSVRAL